ncbi:uncharacterized protein [Rutidosis leptorrhynchoides]|uniref:uncharacterized protein n=1 Tax=Rutidosis leptorrhynchoides TaxID=125765 RepID=UPI003A9913A5
MSTVASKRCNDAWIWTWRRELRGGHEQQQLTDLFSIVNGYSFGSDMDKWMWVGPSSNFTVSHARSIIDSYELGNFVRPIDWCNLVHIKVHIFNWRLHLNRLPAKSNLPDRHIDVGNSSCGLCNTLEETADHLFAKCSITSLIWARIQLWIDLTIPAWNSVDDIWA